MRRGLPHGAGALSHRARSGPPGRPWRRHGRARLLALHRGHGSVREARRHRGRVARRQRGLAALPEEAPVPAHGHQHGGPVVGVRRLARRAAGQEVHLEAGAVAQAPGLADHLDRLAVRQRHEVPVARDVIRDHLRRGGLGEVGQLLLAQHGHGLHALGQRLAALGVVELAVGAQHQAVVARVLDHLGRPEHAAAGVVAAEHGHDHAVVHADVLEAAEDAGGDVDDVPLLQRHLARVAPATPEEAPAAAQHEEHLGRAVHVERVAAVGRLPRGADVEAVGLGDVHVLVGAFGDAAADDGEVLLAVRARRVRVDERGLAGLELAVAHDALGHVVVQVLGAHTGSPSKGIGVVRGFPGRCRSGRRGARPCGR